MDRKFHASQHRICCIVHNKPRLHYYTLIHTYLHDNFYNYFHLHIIAPELVDDEGYLLIASRSVIRQVSLDGQRSRVISSVLNDSIAIAIDYDFK